MADLMTVETKKVILMVEQDVDPSSGLKTILKKEGYEVFSAYGSDGIRETLEGHEPALVIINLGVSKRFGLNVLGKTKEDFPGVPIMVMSLNSRSFSVKGLKRLGAEGCITKPFDVKALKTTLVRFLKGKSWDS